MKITINNIIQEFEEASTLEYVLEQNNLASKFGIAVAVNETIISRSEWQHTILTDDDKVIVIGAVAGG